jgi:hypothetical protein
VNAPPLTADQPSRQALAERGQAPLAASCGVLGDRRVWSVPGRGDAAPSTKLLLDWAGHLMTGPWCLTQASVAKARAELERLLAAAQRPAQVGLRREVEDGRARVILEVSARSGDGADVARVPQIAVVFGDVAGRV